MEKFSNLFAAAKKEMTEGNYLNSLHLLLECKDLQPNVCISYFLLHQLDLFSGVLSLNKPIEAKTNKAIRRQFCNNLPIGQLIQLFKESYLTRIHENSILEPAIFMNGYAHIQNAYCQSNIDLGNRVYIGHHSFIGTGVKIGAFSSIAMNATVGAGEHTKDWLTTHNFAQSFFKTTINNNNLTIGNNCWIGANTFIRNGIKIGDGSIIGAGSVVLKDVPDYSINVGNPSKIIKYRFSEIQIEKLKNLKWWKLPFAHLLNIQFNDISNAITQLQEIDPNLFLLD